MGTTDGQTTPGVTITKTQSAVQSALSHRSSCDGDVTATVLFGGRPKLRPFAKSTGQKKTTLDGKSELERYLQGATH